MDVAQIARKALEILDRDGWCKGSVNFKPGPSSGITIKSAGLPAFAPGNYPAGSHCLGGAWNLALHDCPNFLAGNPELYKPLAKAIHAQYPEIAELGLEPQGSIVNFNDRASVTETGVRAILEKLAAS